MSERTISTKQVFKGRVLSLEVLDVELGSGRAAVREVVRHNGAVAVLAGLPNGKFLLVRQYRKPVEREVLEVVAGCLEPGEPPETCARREVKEETGHEVTTLKRLGTIWPTPGYSSEELHLFYAELAPERSESCTDEDEELVTVELDAGELSGLIASNEIRDAKTITTWFLWRATAR